MIKPVNIENCFASSKMQKYFNKIIGKIFLKIFENKQFLIIVKKYFLKLPIHILNIVMANIKFDLVLISDSNIIIIITSISTSSRLVKTWAGSVSCVYLGGRVNFWLSLSIFPTVIFHLC